MYMTTPAYPNDFFIMIYSDSCGHCQIAKPHWEPLTTKHAGRVFMATELPTDYKHPIDGVPAFLHFRDKKMVGQYAGDRTQTAFSEWIEAETAKKSGGCWMTSRRSRRSRGGRRRKTQKRKAGKK